MLNAIGKKRMALIQTDDLPEHIKARQKIAHQIAQQVCEQMWNIAIDESEKLGRQITGNDALSYMSTIIMDFVARWIVLMDDIRERDDAGILREDLIKEILNGILTCIGCSASYEDEKPLPNGIQRLKKEVSREES